VILKAFSEVITHEFEKKAKPLESHGGELFISQQKFIELFKEYDIFTENFQPNNISQVFN
jgi:hypothetical protein